MYDHKKIEAKWQKIWAEQKLFKADDKDSKKVKFYALDMFPYPSGAGLHVGHPEGYTATDILSRYKRMNGYNVLHPMGWDAFGLPAENYAIKMGTPPEETTNKNIQTFTKQIKSLGFSYDWEREINTSSPEYYKWTQWFFLFLYKNGLAYKKNAPVNWCDSCQTVLANEQVVDGKCERCGSEVIQKKMNQWFFKITDFIEDNGKTAGLISGLDKIDWPESTKISQRNWIGKSQGAEVDFQIACSSTPLEGGRGVFPQAKVLLIHCFEGSSETAWQPWLAEKLKGQGFDVRVPNLPNSAHPDFAETMSFLEKETKDFTENDIVVGHSLGAYFAVKLSERKKFKKIVLVGPSLTGNVKRAKEESARAAGSDVEAPLKVIADGGKLDLNKIQAEQKIAFFSTDDEWIPLEDLKVLEPDFKINKLENRGHFNAKEFTELFDSIFPKIRVFTTRPDTLFGATYMVLAPEHSLVSEITTAEQKAKVQKYIEQTSKKTDLQRQEDEKEKTGVFTGGYAINPVNGKKIPVWIADYVLMGYGTGAIMAVPAHDERDWDFAKKFDLEIIDVIGNMEDRFQKTGGVMQNSEFLDGLSIDEAIQKMISWLEEKGLGERKTTYRLRDWLVSRQRFWGAPIPIVYCEDCGEVAVDEKDLPVILPKDVDFKPTGESPLVGSKTFHNVKCPQCGKPARRESDTMDTFVCSSWYYLRFADAQNSVEFADKKLLDKWLPVDLYVGGAEHTVLHLLYSRFFTKALHKFGYVGCDEPFLKLRHQGMILAEDGRKMSKSLGNVINPDDIVKEYGADTLRMYEMFMGPFDQSVSWSTKSTEGIYRFLQKIYRLYEEIDFTKCDCKKGDCSDAPSGMPQMLHKTIKKVTEDIENFRFNTAISQMMIFINFVNKVGTMPKTVAENFLKLLAPFAPHIAEELWEKMGNQASIQISDWPKFIEALTIDDEIELVIQVNGKLRDKITVSKDIAKEDAITQAKSSEKVQKFLEGQTILKEIFVPGKLVNLVVR